MKNIITHAIIPLLFAALFLSSCKKEKTSTPSNTTSNSFAGKWNNYETSSVNGPATYPVTIEAPNAATILINSLYGFQSKVGGTVVGSTFTIPSQVVDGNSISGSGTLANPAQINMIYYIDTGAYIDSVSAVLTK